MQIAVLSQRVANGRIQARAAFWRDGVPTTDPPIFVNDFDLPLVTSYQRRLEDSAGRWTTQSGQVVMPVVEVGGEWVARPENPTDPYQTETVTVTAAAYARQQALAWAERKVAELER